MVHVQWKWITENTKFLLTIYLAASPISSTPPCYYKVTVEKTTAIDETYLKLSVISGNPSRLEAAVFTSLTTIFPITMTHVSGIIGIPANSHYNTVTTVGETNDNLIISKKELLRCHQRLGHLDFNNAKHLFRTRVLSHTEGSQSLHTASRKTKNIPKPAACLYGKQTARLSPGKIVNIIKHRTRVLKYRNLPPGQEVSSNCFISSVRRNFFVGFNRRRIEDQHMGGYIFVNCASTYIHPESQSSQSSHKILSTKMEYENHCRDVEVVPQNYISTNSKLFHQENFLNIHPGSIRSQGLLILDHIIMELLEM